MINLAAGGIAMLGAYVFYGLRIGGYLFLPPIPFAGKHLQLGGPWATVPAFIVALAVCALTGALFDGIVLRRLRAASPLAKLVASLGLLLTLQAIIILRFGGDTQTAPTVLSESPVSVFGVPVPVNRFILTGLIAVATVLLAVVYRKTRFGIATRAAQENEEAARLTGLSPNRLSMVNTVMAFVLAGAVGIFAAPIAQLDPLVIAFSVIPALAAALIAGFTSFSVAAIAGLGMGIVQSLVIWLEAKSWFPSTGDGPLPGVADVFFFGVIVVVLFLRGAKLPERGAAVERRLPRVRTPSRPLLVAMVLAGVTAVALVAFPFDYRQALTNSLIGALMCLSFVVLTGFIGQMSLLQSALAGVTALVVAKLAHSSGIGFPIAPLLGVLASLAVGLLSALSALRVRGVSLAIVTMAAALAIESFWFENTSFGINASHDKVADPSLFGVGLGTHSDLLGTTTQPSPVFGFMCLAVLVAGALTVIAVRRGELGRRMLAVRSNERAAAAAGISVRETKLAAYAISSVLAGTAGALYAYDYGSVSEPRFAVPIALSLVAFSYLGGITSVASAYRRTARDRGLVHPHRERAAGHPCQLSADRRRPCADDQRRPVPRGHRGRCCRAPRGAPEGCVMTPALVTRGLSVSYGGVQALVDVELDVARGQVVGLIGPNGAGKTTLIDAVTGFTPHRGTVMLNGHDLAGVAPHERARRGLRRTWQSAELFDDLTVAENLVVAGSSGSLWGLARRSLRRSKHDAADPAAVLDRLGLAALADARPDQLSQGRRKLVGVARSLMGEPDIVLLDEPAAGLDSEESEELGAHIRVLADNGPGMLLVDHDMGLVLSVCDHVVVLDFGRVIASGTPATVRADSDVIAAYLGDVPSDIEAAVS